VALLEHVLEGELQDPRATGSGTLPLLPPEVQPLPLFIVDWFVALRKILPEVFGLLKTADRPSRKLFVTLKTSRIAYTLRCAKLLNVIDNIFYASVIILHSHDRDPNVATV